MPAELLNLKQTAEIIGKHPKSFRRWQRSHKGERFTRVVRELEPNQFNRRDIERYLEGANY